MSKTWRLTRSRARPGTAGHSEPCLSEWSRRNPSMLRKCLKYHRVTMGLHGDKAGGLGLPTERCVIVDDGFLQSHSPTRQFQKGPIQAAVTSASAKTLIAHLRLIRLTQQEAPTEVFF